ncbi:MAG: RrF2 family transcriptional regulator [Acidobacteria bacterium]|nr:RrF2 family transcriptional regulator [Acidobacteriota bacterium]
MLFSRPCEYAIRALADLARQPRGRLVPVEEVARREGLAGPFLSRIFYQLARAGLLLSRKGPGGGFQLARPASEIRLQEIVAAIDGLDGWRQCVLGLPQCNEEAPCPLHPMWKRVREEILGYSEKVTLAELARAEGKKRRTKR